MIPFATRTMRYRNGAMAEAAAGLEVYELGGDPAGPLVLFVHGGSWGQGAPWQYALLARRLLEEGGASRVAICKYSLFPHGDVDTMVEDIANGLEWCREQQRAQPKLRVVLAAQSAGAHLCSLYLSRRTAAEAEAWQPDKFVALSGVFDIAKHFAHERTRLVHWLSPMWLAMVGKKTAAGEAVNQQLAIVSSDPADSRGLDADELAAAGLACRDLAAVSRGTVQSSPIEDWTEQEMKAWTVASPTRMLNLGRVAAAGAPRAAAGEFLGEGPPLALAVRSSWPSTVVLHAADDSTVPVTSAREFVDALRLAPCVPDNLDYKEYKSGGHGEIMIQLMSRAPLQELTGIAREFVESVGATQPDER